jgi:1,4-dihydroxy-2-naphthoate octaprenyltransferase
VPALSVWCALPVGALATAILVVNNLRDRVTDMGAGKRTLAVRFGRGFAITQYRALIAVSYLTPLGLVLLQAARPEVLLTVLSLPLALKTERAVASTEGRALNAQLAATAKLLMIFGLLFALGLAAQSIRTHLGMWSPP